MKVKIIKQIPVERKLAPEVGSVHEITTITRSGRNKLYHIKDSDVWVFDHEVEIIEGEK